MSVFKLSSVVLMAVFLAFAHQKCSARRSFGKCQHLRIPACHRLGYNSTRIPPDMYLTMRMSEVRSYVALLDRTNCSSNLLFFLCTMYSPICFKGFSERILPCRSVCTDVYHGCRHVIRLLDIQWPRELECKKLPEYNTGVCIQPSAIIQEKNVRTRNSASSRLPSCPTCAAKSKLKRYRQFKKASYVVAAEVLARVTTASGETKLRVYVHKVLKSGKVNVQQGIVELWSPTTCICAPADFERQYYILGKEDKKRERLLFDRRTLVAEQTPFLKDKIQKWTRQNRKLKEKRRKSNDKKDRRKQRKRKGHST